MVRDGDYVAIFNSIHRVMQAEKLLKGMGLTVLLIPAPRSLTSDCGLAIRFGEDQRPVVEQALASASLLPESTFRKRGESFEPQDSHFLP
jgi:hypothetical protein